MTEWNPSRIEPFVEKLESEDAFERLKAIQDLETITHKTLGFRYNDPPDLRRAAVDRWREMIDGRKREDEKTEKLRQAIELSGAQVDVDTLKKAVQAIPSEKIQSYLNALLLKMKAKKARCEACSVRHATVRVTELDRDQVRTRHLCDTCARERGDVLV
jgi:hypothetical protein